jgi:hypothetical protein
MQRAPSFRDAGKSTSHFTYFVADGGYFVRDCNDVTVETGGQVFLLAIPKCKARSMKTGSLVTIPVS